MTTKSNVPERTVTPRDHRRAATTVKQRLRELGGRLSTVDLRVAERAELRGVDLDCLDVVAQDGPMSPTELARRAGLHPATMTGVLDRLERAGWITRERGTTDRRAVTVRAVPARLREIYSLYAGMNDALDQICDGYDDAQLELLAGFLARVSSAGEQAASALAEPVA
jgi:DNA-binding MarR family transcriptional regulator